MKSNLKEKAVSLRQKGFSYSEILKEIPVAKSTLSLWLRFVGLSRKQHQRLTDKKLLSIQRGWEAKKRQRIEKTKLILGQAKKETEKIRIDRQTLWIIGVMLYWAEGAKEKIYSNSRGVLFSNSDPFMIKVFLKWLKEYLKILDENICFDIYIHENHRGQSERSIKHWSSVTGFSMGKFDKIYYKKHKLSTNRKNTGENYYGILRVRVKRSTDLNRKISGWIEGICVQCGVV